MSFCPALISSVEPPVEVSFIVQLLIDVDLEERGRTSVPGRGTEFSKMVYISNLKKKTFELTFGKFGFIRKEPSHRIGIIYFV